MSKTKKKYYAVARGQVPGIYENWSGPDGAQAQVSGFPGAQYKGFQTIEEAREWLREIQGGGVPKQKTFGFPGFDEEKKPTKKPMKKPAKKDPENDSNIEQDLKKGTVVIYTDGGCIDNPGPGGYGTVLLSGKKRKELSGGFRSTTNNRMELTACIEGLKALKTPCTVKLFSDSQYVVNGITKGWARRWKQKGWMRKADQPAENADLWAQLLDLCDTHKVEFNWVRGHAGNRENERCDQLAGEAARDRKNLSRDTAYETGRTTVA
jgi:ribonuclease HI